MSESAPALDLTDIVRRYGASILRRCRGMLRDDAWAQDAAQEVFLTLLTKGEQESARFRGEAMMSTWIYRVTTNHCLNLIRSEKRSRAREDNDRVHEWMGVPPADPHEQFERRTDLKEILVQLDELNQKIFLYRYLDGLAQEEISDIVGRSRKTIGKRLQAIRKVVDEFAVAQRGEKARSAKTNPAGESATAGESTREGRAP